MAYKIQFDGVNDHIVLSTALTAGGSGTAADWEFGFTWQVETGDEANWQRPFSRYITDTSDRLIFKPSTGELRWYRNNVYAAWTGLTIPATGDYKFVKAPGADSLELFIDTVSQGSKTLTNMSSFPLFQYIGADLTYSKGFLHNFYHTDNLTGTNSVNFACDEGTGVTITDSINGVTGTLTNGPVWVSTGGSDTTPDAFSFTDQTDVALSTLTTSNTITVTGIDASTPISITGGEYSVNGGAYTSTAGNVVVNDTVTLRVTSSASNSTAVNVTLDIGGVTDIWTVTTVAAGDTTPDAFSFTDQTDVALSILTTSNTITVTGIDTSTPISITGGEYSVNGGAFTTAAGNVVVNDTVQLRATSSGSFNTQVNVLLDIGGVQDTWSLTTVLLSTDVLHNNTESIHASQAVVWSWLPAGRFGVLSAITPQDGTGTTAADGILTISNSLTPPGILLVAVQNTDATDDDVYYEAFS